MSFTLKHQMDSIFLTGLQIVRQHEVLIRQEWNQILEHLQNTGNKSSANMKATIDFFSESIFTKDENHLNGTALPSISEIHSNHFFITLLENAVHKVIQSSKASSYDHQAIQYLFSKISEELLPHPYHQYFSIDSFVKDLVSSNQLPIEWTAILVKKGQQYIVEKYYHTSNYNLLFGTDPIYANSIFAVSDLLLEQMPVEERIHYTVLPVPYEDVTLLVCTKKEVIGSVVPFLTYILQIFQNGKELYIQSKYELQWKDSVILFNESILRSKNFNEAVENITAGFVNYLPFERCALFSYSVDHQMGFGVFGYRLDIKEIQSITEDVNNLPIIQNNLQILQLFGKSLDYLQPIYIGEAAAGFPSHYVRQFNLRSIVIAPIFVTSSSRLLGAAILDQGPGKYFKIGQDTFKALVKFGQSAGEILAKFHFDRDDPLRSDPIHLSPREIEVLKLMAEGASTNEAASLLHLSEYTVRDYVSAIMQKMDARNRTEAVARAIREGLI